MAVITAEDAREIARAALSAHGCDAVNAAAVADTIARAERDGAASHGLFRLPGYIASLKSGKANGASRPRIAARAPAVLHVDGDGGYAPVAHQTLAGPLVDAAKSQGVALAAVTNTHHFSALWAEVELLAEQGVAALACVSFKPALPPAGGIKPLYGTNPMAFAWPRPGQNPVVFDQASAVMARGEVMIAARDGHQLPEGAGIGPDGQPTTDPNEVLKGALLPFGGYKGAPCLAKASASRPPKPTSPTAGHRAVASSSSPSIPLPPEATPPGLPTPNACSPRSHRRKAPASPARAAPHAAPKLPSTASRFSRTGWRA
jgi:delta1-piperideine-2-carboxylate reductase